MMGPLHVAEDDLSVIPADEESDHDRNDGIDQAAAAVPRGGRGSSWRSRPSGDLRRGNSAAISGIGSLGKRIRSPGGKSRSGGKAAGGYRTCAAPGSCGSIVWRDCSTSSCVISDSICALNSLEARLNSLSALADLASDFGQLLGPKEDQGNQEEEDHLWEAQVHISHDTAGGDWRQSSPVPDVNELNQTTEDTEDTEIRHRHLGSGGSNLEWGQANSGHWSARSQWLLPGSRNSG